MKEIYFIIDNVKYIVLHENSKLKICKKENDRIVPLQEHEYQIIKKLFDDKHGMRLYYEDISSVNELLDKNSNLYNNEVLKCFNSNLDYTKTYISNILFDMLEQIPEHLRNPFFFNLSTIKMQFVDDLKETVPGCYEPTANVLSFNRKYFANLISSKDYDKLGALITVVLVHELYHAASTDMIGKNNDFASGFVDRKTGIEYSSITEGLTELLTFFTVPREVYLKAGANNIYFEETAIAAQIFCLLEKNSLFFGYFHNDLAETKKGFHFHDDAESIDLLFETFELYFCVKGEAKSENLLATTQCILLRCLESKLRHILNSKNYYIDYEGEIVKLLDSYERYLLTPLNLPGEEHKEISNNLQEFNRIKNYYLYYLGTTRISSKKVS